MPPRPPPDGGTRPTPHWGAIGSGRGRGASVRLWSRRHHLRAVASDTPRYGWGAVPLAWQAREGRRRHGRVGGSSGGTHPATCREQGFNLEKVEEGSPTSPMRTFEYGLIDRQTTTAVFDGHYGLDFIETFLERVAPGR